MTVPRDSSPYDRQHSARWDSLPPWIPVHPSFSSKAVLDLAELCTPKDLALMKSSDGRRLGVKHMRGPEAMLKISMNTDRGRKELVGWVERYVRHADRHD